MIDQLRIQDIMTQEEANAAISEEVMEASPGIQSEEEADDILGKIQWAEQKIAENLEKVKAKKEWMTVRLEAYERDLNGSLEGYVSWQRGRLESYAREQLKNKKGVLKLFNGNLKLSAPRTEYKYEDEKQIIDWLKENKFDTCIRHKEELDKVKFKSTFKDTDPLTTKLLYNGEAIPGLTLNLPKEPAFSLGARAS